MCTVIMNATYEQHLRVSDLAETLKQCLDEANYLDLPMVGVHLSNAVEALARNRTGTKLRLVQTSQPD